MKQIYWEACVLLTIHYCMPLILWTQCRRVIRRERLSRQHPPLQHGCWRTPQQQLNTTMTPLQVVVVFRSCPSWARRALC